MPLFDAPAFRAQQLPVIVPFPGRRAPKRRSGARSVSSPSPEVTVAGVTDVRDDIAGTVSVCEVGEPDPGLVAVVADLVSGATISGAAGGRDMAASEIGEPESVSGGAQLAGSGGEAPVLDEAPTAVALEVPSPAPDTRVHGTAPGPACEPPAKAMAMLTNEVVLADRVVVAFGTVVAGGAVRTNPSDARRE